MYFTEMGSFLTFVRGHVANFEHVDRMLDGFQLQGTIYTQKDKIHRMHLLGFFYLSKDDSDGCTQIVR